MAELRCLLKVCAPMEGRACNRLERAVAKRATYETFETKTFADVTAYLPLSLSMLATLVVSASSENGLVSSSIPGSK